MDRKIHNVNWEIVCSSKDRGGLGIQKLSSLNKAFLGEWCWRFGAKAEGLLNHYQVKLWGKIRRLTYKGYERQLWGGFMERNL